MARRALSFGDVEKPPEPEPKKSGIHHGKTSVVVSGDGGRVTNLTGDVSFELGMPNPPQTFSAQRFRLLDDAPRDANGSFTLTNELISAAGLSEHDLGRWCLAHRYARVTNSWTQIVEFVKSQVGTMASTTVQAPSAQQAVLTTPTPVDFDIEVKDTDAGAFDKLAQAFKGLGVTVQEAGKALGNVFGMAAGEAAAVNPARDRFLEQAASKAGMTKPKPTPQDCPQWTPADSSLNACKTCGGSLRDHSKAAFTAWMNDMSNRGRRR